jgi:hypothetical protein
MTHLYSSIEINQIQQDLPYLIEVMDWVKNFLAKSHPELGRSGPVCPFVPHALKSNSIQLAVIRADNLQQQQVEELVKSYRDIFLQTEPRDRETGLSKAFLLIFPDIDMENTAKRIDAVQQKLKPFFVEEGLMLGEFHKRTESGGLHNPNFRPLRSPIPILAIRFMTEFDLPFLIGGDDVHLRIRYIEAYLQQFETCISDETRLKTAYQALSLAREELLRQSICV